MDKTLRSPEWIQPDLFTTQPMRPSWWMLPVEVQERLHQLLKRLLHEHLAGQHAVPRALEIGDER